jgi:RND family efflux transporter MFP subunit
MKAIDMKTLRQLILFCLVIVAGLYVWVTYVPAATPLLQRVGFFDLIGIEPTPVAEAQQDRRRFGGGAAQVVAVSVGERALADRVSAIGDGRARRSVPVRSNAIGVITELGLSAGAFVESGTVILKLEDETQQIALEQAKIESEDAQAEAERVKQLQSTGATSEVRLREVEMRVRNAELTLRQARFNLSQRQVVAPISGWVGIIDLEQGDRVSAQDVLVTITDRSDILIDFRVPERFVSKIKVGQTFDVTPLALSATSLTGEISAIDSTVERASRTLLVQGRVANDNDLLRAGMAFSVEMSFPGETVLSIAPLPLQWSSEGPYVWVVREDKVARAAVSISQRNSDEVLVTSDDLTAGELVVTEGVQTLRPGAEVKVANQGAPTEPRDAGQEASL